MSQNTISGIPNITPQATCSPESVYAVWHNSKIPQTPPIAQQSSMMLRVAQFAQQTHVALEIK